MFGIFKKNKTKKHTKKNEAEHTESEELGEPVWHELGEGNPFDHPILDIRSVTLNLVATTTEKWIAENYVASRSDDGKQYIDQHIPGSKKIDSNLRYPHNGEQLEGIVSKAESMDEKWDIYAYGDWFYFVRSWTSELVYKAHYQNTGSELVLDYIMSSDESNASLQEQNIHSIILTYVLGRVWPYHIPEHMQNEGGKAIAMYLFSMFGSKATLATSANVLNIKLKEK